MKASELIQKLQQIMELLGKDVVLHIHTMGGYEELKDITYLSHGTVGPIKDVVLRPQHDYIGKSLLSRSVEIPLDNELVEIFG